MDDGFYFPLGGVGDDVGSVGWLSQGDPDAPHDGPGGIDALLGGIGGSVGHAGGRGTADAWSPAPSKPGELELDPIDLWSGPHLDMGFDLDAPIAGASVAVPAPAAAAAPVHAAGPSTAAAAVPGVYGGVYPSSVYSDSAAEALEEQRQQARGNELVRTLMPAAPTPDDVDSLGHHGGVGFGVAMELDNPGDAKPTVTWNGVGAGKSPAVVAAVAPSPIAGVAAPLEEDRGVRTRARRRTATAAATEPAPAPADASPPRSRAKRGTSATAKASTAKRTRVQQPQQPRPLTAEDKRIRRLERNRESARQSRLRKKEHLQTLEAKVATLASYIDKKRLELLKKADGTLRRARTRAVKRLEACLDESGAAVDVEGLTAAVKNLRVEHGPNSKQHQLHLSFFFSSLLNLLLPQHVRFFAWLMSQPDHVFAQPRAGSAVPRSTEKGLPLGPEGEGLWSAFCHDLNLTADQSRSLSNGLRVVFASNTRHTLARVVEHLHQFRVLLQRRAANVQLQIDALLDVLTPEQTAAFYSWVERNRATLSRHKPRDRPPDTTTLKPQNPSAATVPGTAIRAPSPYRAATLLAVDAAAGRPEDHVPATLGAEDDIQGRVKATLTATKQLLDVASSAGDKPAAPLDESPPKLSRTSARFSARRP